MATNLFDPALLALPPFNTLSSEASLPTSHSNLAYEQAKVIALSAALDLDDIAFLTRKFWNLHLHPVLPRDGAAMTLLTIQYNLVIGTLSRYVSRQQYLLPLIDDLLKYRVHGQFMLTELGYGLDAKNLQTTATLLPSGDFELSSPTEKSAKFMPPSIPAGAPTIAVVFARLVVNGSDRGLRPFIVSLNDGVSMSPGVIAKRLPPRGGTQIVNHAITTFHGVRLPATALLGSVEEAEDFSRLISRVAVGSLALGFTNVSMISSSATIGYLYSQRRTVTGPKGAPVPIFSFSSQQKPIALATAQAHVLGALARWSSSIFSDTTVEWRVRHGIAAVAKALMVRQATDSCLAISDRCGAQGLFGVNQMLSFLGTIRGVSIAEGDILVLSIRLTMELLLKKYELPPSTHPESLVARHEAALFAELLAILSNAAHHRDASVNRRILPRCQSFVDAIGHRMAYDAALDTGVMPACLDLYVADVVQRDGAWYAEEAGVGRVSQIAALDDALDAILPHLERLIEELGARPYLSAPIVSDEAWKGFEGGLQVLGQSENIAKSVGVEVNLVEHAPSRFSARL